MCRCGIRCGYQSQIKTLEVLVARFLYLGWHCSRRRPRWRGCSQCSRRSARPRRLSDTGRHSSRRTTITKMFGPMTEMSTLVSGRERMCRAIARAWAHAVGVADGISNALGYMGMLVRCRAVSMRPFQRVCMCGTHLCSRLCTCPCTCARPSTGRHLGTECCV